MVLDAVPVQISEIVKRIEEIIGPFQSQFDGASVYSVEDLLRSALSFQEDRESRHTINAISGDLKHYYSGRAARAGAADAKIIVEADEHQVLLTLVPPRWGGRTFSYDDLLKELRRSRVKFGQNYLAIESAFAKVAQKGEFVYRLLIAESSRGRRGTDGRLDFQVPVLDKSKIFDPDSLSLRSFGSMVAPLIKGDLALRIVSPTPGRPGKTVSGEEIPAESGRPVEARLGDGLRLDRNKRDVFATTEGGLILDDGVLHIRPCTVLRDAPKQDVEVEGVLVLEKGAAGVHLTCADLYCEGDLDAVTAVVQSDAAVRGRVTAPEGKSFEVKGRLHAESLGGGECRIWGDAWVVRNISETKLLCGETVRVLHASGIVRASEVRAMVGIQISGVDGSDAPVVLEVGRDYLMTERVGRVESDLEAAKQRIGHIETMKAAVVKMGADPLSLPPEKQDAYLSLLEELGVLKQQVLEYEGTLDSVNTGQVRFKQAMIKITGSIEPLLEVQIGTETRKVEASRSGVLFHLSAKEGISMRDVS